MHALSQPIVQATIIGVVGLFLQRLAIHFVFDPMEELSKLRATASYRLVFYANVQKDSTNINEAQTDFRDLAAKILGFIHRRNCLLFWMPSKPELLETSKALIGLSNGLDSVDFGWKKSQRKKVIDTLSLGIEP